MLAHDFWLFKEGERAYTDDADLYSRRDAPVVIHDDILQYLGDTFSWVPTLNPALPTIPAGYGLNWYGPTVINHTGGALFQQICTSWAQLFSYGPERLELQQRGPYCWEWPFDEDEHVLSAAQFETLFKHERLEVDRAWLVQTLTRLSQFGAQAAEGGFFLLHIGI